MKVLEAFIQEKNRWYSIVGGDPLKMPTDILEVIHLRNLIELELEPEFLYQDGEASVEQVKLRRAYMKRAQEDLEALRVEITG